MSDSEGTIGTAHTEKREFLTHVRNYLSASAFVSVLGFLSITVLTHLLTPAEYGILAVFLGIVSFFAVLLELNLRGAVNRYYLERTPDFPSFLRTVLLFLAGFVGFNLVALWVLRRPLATFFEIDESVFYVAIVCAALQIPWNLNWKLQVARLESGSYARLSAVRTVALFLTGAIWIFSIIVPRDVSMAQAVTGQRVSLFPEDADLGAQWGQIRAMFVVSLVIGAWLTARLVRIAQGGHFKRSHLAYALAFGIPLMPHSLSSFALNFFDRVIVNQLSGERAAGLYSFAYNVGMAMSLVVTAMNQAWLPIFSRYRDAGDHASIARLSVSYARYVYAIALILTLFSRELAVALASDEYLEGLPLIPIIIFGYVFLFLYTLYSTHAFYLRRTGLISLATLLAGATNILFNYLLIPRFGFQAAAWTTLGSYVLLFASHYAIARFVLHECIVPLRSLLPGLISTAVVASAFLWAETFIQNYWLVLAALKLPIVGVLIVWIHRNRSEHGAGLS